MLFDVKLEVKADGLETLAPSHAIGKHNERHKHLMGANEQKTRGERVGGGGEVMHKTHAWLLL